MAIDVVRVMQKTFVGHVEYRPSLDSTNARAAQLSAGGASDLPLLVVADRQTAGRGRGANRWWTGPGSLAFSLLVDAEMVAADETRSPLVSPATALAVADVIAPLLPRGKVGIHMPNDVMVRVGEAGDDRKICGILVDVLPDRRHVIGIGLNVNDTVSDAPAELQNRLTTLRDVGNRQFNRTDVLIALLGALEKTFASLRADPQKVMRRVEELASTL